MANYAAIITDNLDGTWTVTVCNRGTTSTTVTGGTSLLTNTFTQTASTGVLATASGFQNATSQLTLRSPYDAFERCVEMIRCDRAFNL